MIKFEFTIVTKNSPASVRSPKVKMSSMAICEAMELFWLETQECGAAAGSWTRPGPRQSDFCPEVVKPVLLQEMGETG